MVKWLDHFPCRFESLRGLHNVTHTQSPCEKSTVDQRFGKNCGFFIIIILIKQSNIQNFSILIQFGLKIVTVLLILPGHQPYI